MESSPGAGSTFTILLPASENTTTQQLQSSVVKKTSVKAKTLIMDDEEMVRTIVREMLIQLGHEVVLSADGTQAKNIRKRFKQTALLIW